MMLGLALSGYRPPTHPRGTAATAATAPPRTLRQDMLDRSLALLPQYSPAQLTATLWALGRLGWPLGGRYVAELETRHDLLSASLTRRMQRQQRLALGRIGQRQLKWQKQRRVQEQGMPQRQQ